MSRAFAFVFVSASLLACAKREAPRPPRPPAARPPVVERVAPCERAPTDLARARVPYPNAVTWSGDGALVAAAVGQSGEASTHVEGADGVVVWSVADGAVKKRYRIDAQAVAFARRGERLAFASIWGSGVVDLRTDCVTRWPRRGPLVAWAPGDRALFVAGDRGVAAIDPATGARLHEWTAEPGAPRLVAMSVAPSAIAIGDELHDVRVLRPDLSRAEALPSTPNAIGNARGVAIAPDGSRAAYAEVEEIPIKYPPGTMPGSPSTHRFFVRVVSLPDAEVRARFPGDAEALAFSPDGGSLAIAGDLDQRLVVRTLATNETRVLEAKVSFPREVAWSPDGRSIALADWRGAVRVYDASGAASPRVLAP